MAIAFVQDDTFNPIADGGTLAFGSNVGSGVLLVALIRIASGTIIVNALTDTLGNTWALAEQSAATGGANCSIWYAPCPTGGACTVTFDWTGTANGMATLAEFSGFSGGVTAGPTNSVANGTNTTTHSAGDITTTVADSLLTAIFCFESAFTVNSRLTDWNALVGNSRYDASYKIASATETTDGQITTVDVERGPSAIAAFSETTGGGGFAPGDDASWHGRAPERVPRKGGMVASGTTRVNRISSLADFQRRLRTGHLTPQELDRLTRRRAA
jgi:hypothetical protein